MKTQSKTQSKAEGPARPDKHYDVSLTRKAGAVVATIKPCDMHEVIAESGLKLPDEVMDVVADLIVELALRDGRKKKP